MSACLLSRRPEGDLLERALSGRLTEAERLDFSAHLQTFCEDCLTRLATVGGEELLHALAGPQALLSDDEADRMFRTATSATQNAIQRAALQQLRRRFQPRTWQTMGVAAAVLLIGLVSFDRLQSRNPTGDVEKGTASGMEAALLLFTATPQETHRFDPHEKLLDGSALMFRYRISVAAHVYLYDAESKVLLWEPDVGAPPSAAGEAELTEHGRALALPIDRAPKRGPLVLVASPRLLSGDEVRRLAADPSFPCTGCGLDRVWLSP